MDQQKSKIFQIPKISNFKNLNSDFVGLSVRTLISITCVVVFLILMSGVWDKYKSEYENTFFRLYFECWFLI